MTRGEIRTPVIGAVSAALIFALTGCGSPYSGTVYDKETRYKQGSELVKSVGSVLTSVHKDVPHYYLLLENCTTRKLRTKEQTKKECPTGEREVAVEVYNSANNGDYYPTRLPKIAKN